MPNFTTAQGAVFKTGAVAAQEELVYTVSDTKSAAGTATTPAANAIVTAVASPGAGTYRVIATISLTGTAETQLTNLRMRVNTVNVATVATIPGTTTYVFDRITVTAGNIDLLVPALATTGAIYTCALQANQIA